jgi:hypothetical protein
MGAGKYCLESVYDRSAPRGTCLGCPADRMPATVAFLLVLLMLLFCGKRSPALADTPLKAGGLASLPTQSATSIPVNNSGFEQGEHGWLFGADKAFAVDKSEAHGGSASLRFEAGVATKRSPSVQYPLPSVTPGLYRLRFWIKTEQLESPKAGKAGVRVSIEYRSQDGNHSRAATRVYAGSRKWELAEVSLALPETLRKGSACISIHRYGTPLGGKAWFDDISCDRIEPPPVECFLCYPNFRGFLPANGLKKVRLWLQVNDATRRDPVRVVVRRADGSSVADQSVHDSGSGRILELEAGTWPLGEYRVDVSIGDYHYPHYLIQKVPDEEYLKLAVRFDQDNVLNLRGTRTFPLGLYTTSGCSNAPKNYLDSHLNKISEAPINFLINYWLTGAPVEAKRAYLAAQRKYGIHYLATVNNFHLGRYPDHSTPLLRSILPEVSGALKTEEQVDLFLQRYAKALRNESNLAGWYVMDERPLDDVPLHFRQYQVLRQADPDHLTLGISNRSGELACWRDTVDVLGMDPYPLFNMKSGKPLTLVGAQTRATVEATHGSRPAWMVLQFFQGWSTDRWPTEEELRTMSLMAITEGARGLFYWSFGTRALAWVKDPKDKEAYWQRLVKVTKELKSIEPALLAPDAPDLLAGTSNAAIRWRARAANGKCYLFAYLPAKTFSERFETPATHVTFTLKDGRTITKAFRPDTADWFAVELANK